SLFTSSMSSFLSTGRALAGPNRTDDRLTFLASKVGVERIATGITPVLVGLIAGGSSPGLISIAIFRTTITGWPVLVGYVRTYVSVIPGAATPEIVVIGLPFPPLSRL